MLMSVGFPKTGTTTLSRALREAGMTVADWVHDNKPVGALIYRGWYRRGDPFHFFEGVDAISQSDYLRPPQQDRKGSGSFWPGLDIALLLAIRRMHPDTRFILTARDPQKTVRSMANWYDMQRRLTQTDIPGLPRGFGETTAELVRWIETHHAAVRDIFAGDPRFLEVDITAGDAHGKLEAFLGRKLPWWGQVNVARPDYAGMSAHEAHGETLHGDTLDGQGGQQAGGGAESP